MSFPKLTKEEVNTRAELAEKFNVASANIEDAMDRIDQIINDELIPQVRQFNDLVKQISDFRDSTVAQMEEHIEEQREGWDETDAGASYVDWKDSWESIHLDTLPIPDTVQRDENVEMAEAFEALENSPA